MPKALPAKERAFSPQAMRWCWAPGWRKHRTLPKTGNRMQQKHRVRALLKHRVWAKERVKA